MLRSHTYMPTLLGGSLWKAATRASLAAAIVGGSLAGSATSYGDESAADAFRAYAQSRQAESSFFQSAQTVVSPDDKQPTPVKQNDAWGTGTTDSTDPADARSSLTYTAMVTQSDAPAGTSDALAEDEPRTGVGSTQSIYGSQEERLPRFVDGELVLPNLLVPTTDQSGIGNGRIPESFRDEQADLAIVLPESSSDRGFTVPWTLKQWTAANTFSHPRYFEDRMLERHGHERFGYLQPFASGIRFVATVPMLPYLMAISDPYDCEYTLGYYRVGNCAPRLYQRPPRDRRAIVAESLALSTAILALP
ncbi:MAG: hypothetical protein AAGA03_01370 [Planctomycetota bacterium]